MWCARARSSGSAVASVARSGGPIGSRPAPPSGSRDSSTPRLDRGVYLPPSAYEVGFVSLAHDTETLQTAATALIAAAVEADTA